MLKFECAIEAIIMFVKSIKKASNGMFTLLASQLCELLTFTQYFTLILSFLFLFLWFWF